MSEEPEFVKIVVDIPEGDLDAFGEGMWTKQVGEDLYEVWNSPWHSREINFLDIVRAVAPAADKNPVFQNVHERRGHRTIQIIFMSDSDDMRRSVLSGLNERGATYENANGKLFSIDFEPMVDWTPAMDYLRELEGQKVLEFRWSAY